MREINCRGEQIFHSMQLEERWRKRQQRFIKMCRLMYAIVLHWQEQDRGRDIFKNRNIPIITDDRLVEMSFGIYEGTEQSARALDCPINILFKEPEKYKAVEGGESIEKLFERTGDFLRNVVEPQLEDGKNIVIIGHGAMNSGIICQVRGLSTEHFWDAGINQCELLQLK